MNCIIIDDDKLSRKIIEEFIKKTEGLKLLESFADPVDAINFLKREHDTHLIFLDIEMPEMSGIDFMNLMKDPMQIIIVSSKDKYALNAFEYDVTDYLLKPVNYSRFLKAIDKVLSRFEKNKMNFIGKNEIFIKKNSYLVKLNYDDILWIEALENYVVFNTFKEKYTIHFTMKAAEQKLPVNRFVRVHRSYIINTSSIYVIEDNNIIIKTEEGNKIIPIGKSYKENLMKDINIILK